ncbi:PREDICTED: probable serine/threonine-protein kinase drkA [Amphimedon queenslandica]|uniref:Protein kinase domain-containing protein n=3 Tax=Amphimedon queenslandica TaxID=400682 RepID=A0AAN0JTU0_AMPQE|nr:PREDICTED: probable serine/threonine-protein kinase drkA [Amphimedon queenslandica]|eukprot:XP_019860462.1 PREDICTED: probable serine/threonine-protein kinase drkA [Amphimedon queenslandica]
MHADITWYSTNFDHITQCCEELFDNLEERRSSFRQRASRLQEVHRLNIEKIKEINEDLTSRFASLQMAHDNLAKSHDNLKKEHQELQKSNETLTISHEELQMSHDNLEIAHQQEVTRHQKSQEENENRLQQVNQSLVQTQTELATKQNEVIKLQNTLQKLENNWKVSHTELSLSKNQLGKGGWGVVWIGEFRGQKVAVKQMHNIIKSDEFIKLLHREINTMSQLRHPNLLQFIGAVLDDPSDNPMIITEVMDTSLRNAYKSKELTPDPGCRPVILSIMRDVAVGLNYLHCLPDPIIHRDVSSANVLLESKGDKKWKTKISDFGSASLAHAAVTEAPGALVYSAPESIATLYRKKRKQTPKMDSYSYGVLLCEILTCSFPEVEKFETLSLQVRASSPRLHQLIVLCINEEPDKRPTMSEIIVKLDRFIANEEHGLVVVAPEYMYVKELIV